LSKGWSTSQSIFHLRLLDFHTPLGATNRSSSNMVYCISANQHQIDSKLVIHSSGSLATLFKMYQLNSYLSCSLLGADLGTNLVHNQLHANLESPSFKPVVLHPLISWKTVFPVPSLVSFERISSSNATSLSFLILACSFPAGVVVSIIALSAGMAVLPKIISL